MPYPSPLFVFLYLGDDRQYHGTALGRLVEVARQVGADLVLDAGPVGYALVAAALQTLENDALHLLDEVLRLLLVYEAARDDLRPGDEGAVLARKGQDYDYHAVLCQVLSVPEHDAAHVAHAVAVHKDPPGGHGAVDAGAVGVHLNDLADVGNDDVPGVHAHPLGQLGVDFQVPLLAVDGDKKPGLHQGVDDLQLVGAGVAGDVELPGPLVDHLGALPVQLVDHGADGVLIAGDSGGGDNHLFGDWRRYHLRWHKHYQLSEPDICCSVCLVSNNICNSFHSCFPIH